MNSLHHLHNEIKPPAALLAALHQQLPSRPVFRPARNLLVPPAAAAVLQCTIAAVASLGPAHTLAGAAALVASQPSPVTITVNQPVTPITFTVTEMVNLGSWRLGGSLPAGLKLVAVQDQSVVLTGPGVLDATSEGSREVDDYGYATGTPGNTTTHPLLTGTPTQPGTYAITLQTFQSGAQGGQASPTFNYTIIVASATAPNTLPAFTTQPAPQTVNVGTTVTLTAIATGTPAPGFQWQKNSVPIPGATGATLTLNNVQASDAGAYTVVATNAAGNTLSVAAAIAVNPPGTTPTPSFARHPVAHVVSGGSTVVFSADVAHASAYQWRKDGSPIAGATRATLVIRGATAADAGSYSVTATNASGSATSAPAALVWSSDPSFGHLINLSIRANITADDPFFTIGTAIAGGTTSGAKPLLVRAVGPSLAAFGLESALDDARLEMFAGASTVAANDNWDGVSTLSTVFAQVGAFPFASAGSKDAAVFNPGLAAGSYTVQVSGVGGATGEVLAELYDASPAAAFSESAPRLVNVSVRKQINANGSLTAGFVLGGQTSRTVLVRAIGPGLAAFGLTGVMADPQLALFSGTDKIAQNDNWGGDAQINTAGATVGAFAITDAASRDAMLLITLRPGGYTVEVSGAAGAAGETLVEIYEVP